MVSKLSLPNLVTSHLSVIFTTIIPLLTAASLGHALLKLSDYHHVDPLAAFGISVSQPWAIILGWSISGVPFLPLVFGICVRLAWVTRGDPVYKHLRRCLK